MGHDPTAQVVAGQPDRAPPRLLDSLGRLFGPFVALFGSVAAVTAALVFAGFLSDYGAYRLAGLPRLNLNITGLAEQGASTLIDSLSLLAGGMRWAMIALLLLGLLALWGWHEAPRLQPWARSPAVHRLARMALLLFAVLLTSGLVERAQRSLSGAHHGQAALEDALSIAYGRANFPTPYDRQLEIERQTYELQVFRAANWGARLDVALANWWAGPAATSSGKPTGLALRQLPEARTAARHVYGWLGLSALALCIGTVLLAWWGLALQPLVGAPGAAEGLPASAPGPTATQSAPSAPLRALHRLVGLLGNQAGAPIERVLAPLTLLLAVLSLALLPLAHGLLARESLGAETVMVYLDNGAAETKDIREQKLDSQDPGTRTTTRRSETSVQDPPESAEQSPKARLDCPAKLLDNDLATALRSYREAQRDFLDERPTEGGFETERTNLYSMIEALGKTSIATACADSVALLWSAMPSHGVRALYPEVAEAYQRMFRRVQTAYGVRVGILLGYPRDGEGLTLLEAVVPLPLPRGGQASMVELPRDTILALMVIPDIELRRLQPIQRQVQVDPDSEKLGELFFASNADALEAALDLLERKKLHANASGVGITSLGRLAGVSSLDRPHIATRAIDLLDNILRRDPSDAWVEKSQDIRGAAATAMQLPKSPYAAHRFIISATREPIPADGCSAMPAGTGAGQPLSCLPMAATAAGYLFQDLVSELQNFRSRPPPTALTDDLERLASLMMSIIARPDTRDDVRSAACTALGFAGKFDAPKDLTDQYWAYLQALKPAQAPFSSPVCMLRATLLGLDRQRLRPWLRDVARGKPFAALDAQNPNLHRSMRRTALVALADLGLADEDQLLFDVYVEAASPSNRELSSLVTRMLSEVASEPMARHLVGCALEASRTDAVRTNCLRGLKRLDNGYDGDDGTAARLHAAIAGGMVHDTGEACGTLNMLHTRGSRWLLRLPDDDPVLTRCKTAQSSEE